MASKRDFDEADDGEIQQPASKRSKKQNSKSRQHQHSGIDPTWGQKYVFSATSTTTIPAGEESDFEDDADAMAYLNSVRQQANGIPHLLVAPKVQIGPQLPDGFVRDDDDDDNDADRLDRTIYSTGIGDSRGYYQDGAYVAMPEGDYEQDQGSEEDDINDEKSLHDAYFASIMDQYLRLRSIVQREPPSNARSRLSRSQVTFAEPFSRTTSPVAVWSRLIRTADPHPLQVALMSKDTTLRVLRVLLGGKFLRRGYTLLERTSRWLWALLARLPEKGELNHLEIGWVRDLGRRAVLLGRSLAEMAALREELAEGGLGAHEAVDRSSSDEDGLVDDEEFEVEGAISAGDEEDQDQDQDSAPEDKHEARPNTTTGHVTGTTTESQALPDTEEGEVDDDQDVAMDIESDSEAEDGEIASEPTQDLEQAKARLLASLENAGASDDQDQDQDENQDQNAQEEADKETARQRSRANLRATLNMILTVAGEFYGQRDLLEFREPFVGM